MKNYYIFAKLATEGDFLHFTASVYGHHPDHYIFTGNQLAYSKKQAILRFITSGKINYSQINKLLKVDFPNMTCPHNEFLSNVN
jgi:hypothetical protein